MSLWEESGRFSRPIAIAASALIASATALALLVGAATGDFSAFRLLLLSIAVIVAGQVVVGIAVWLGFSFVAFLSRFRPGANPPKRPFSATGH